MSPELILVSEPRRGVRVLTLNRPEKRNALSIPLVDAFCQAIEAAHAADSVRALVIAGAGPAFCAGLDLTEALEEAKSHRSAELVACALHQLMHSPVVTIAAAQGAALAGGAGFMLACDMIVAADDLKIGFPEVRRGLVAALVMTFLRRKMPEALARELLLTGEPISAARAMSAGLVNRVVPREQALGEALELAASALKAAPRAIIRSKHLFDELWDAGVAEHLDRAQKLHRDMRVSEEAREGLAAFHEKRLPKWDRGT